jgi:hypothetical protein
MLYKRQIPTGEEKIMKWNYEHTDTFSGEANYCWVNRGIVDVTCDNPVKAVKKALGMENVPCKRIDYGDMIELRPYRICQVIFINWHDCGKVVCDCS